MFLLESFVNKLSSFRRFMLDFLNKSAQPDADTAKDSDDNKPSDTPQASPDSVQKGTRRMVRMSCLLVLTVDAARSAGGGVHGSV